MPSVKTFRLVPRRTTALADSDEMAGVRTSATCPFHRRAHAARRRHGAGSCTIGTNVARGTRDEVRDHGTIEVTSSVHWDLHRRNCASRDRVRGKQADCRDRLFSPAQPDSHGVHRGDARKHPHGLECDHFARHLECLQNVRCRRSLRIRVGQHHAERSLSARRCGRLFYEWPVSGEATRSRRTCRSARHGRIQHHARSISGGLGRRISDRPWSDPGARANVVARCFGCHRNERRRLGTRPSGRP